MGLSRNSSSAVGFRRCDPGGRDDDGWTALDWAIAQGQEQFLPDFAEDA